MLFSTATVHDLLFAGDYTVNTATEVAMQRSMKLFASGCLNFGLTINTDKRVIMHPRNTAFLESMLTAANSKDVDSFAYLSITLTRCIEIGEEVTHPDLQTEPGLRSIAELRVDSSRSSSQYKIHGSKMRHLDNAAEWSVEPEGLQETAAETQ
ncbi:hypothetical protein SprV_0702382600 [Sparganum proliferum]